MLLVLSSYYAQQERDYLNQLPTSFALPADAVDRLRAAAKKIILSSPDFQQMLAASERVAAVDNAPGASRR